MVLTAEQQKRKMQYSVRLLLFSLTALATEAQGSERTLLTLVMATEAQESEKAT